MSIRGTVLRKLYENYVIRSMSVIPTSYQHLSIIGIGSHDGSNSEYLQ